MAFEKITLKPFASDTIDPHNDGENSGSYMTPPADSASGVVEMMVNQRSDMQGAMWKPYVMTKSQTLNRLTGLTSVFVNYRDAAGNESKVYAATIHVGPGSPGLYDVYLPVSGVDEDIIRDRCHTTLARYPVI